MGVRSGERGEGVGLLGWLDEAMALAARTMDAESGGLSACTVHKDGRVTGGFKYQEGRLAALAEVERLARAGRMTSETLGAIGETWERELEQRRVSEPSSPMWVAYTTGGREAMREAVGRFEGDA